MLRKRGVGDVLRGVYNGLAQDPNSLSNLDQDLPNFIQDQVPIYSLPQEWLWCESWCSMETKKNAKTIDLCNNPLYKEPKLDMAKRVISGDLFKQSWIAMDEEIHDFENSILTNYKRQPERVYGCLLKMQWETTDRINLCNKNSLQDCNYQDLQKCKKLQ